MYMHGGSTFFYSAAGITGSGTTTSRDYSCSLRAVPRCQMFRDYSPAAVNSCVAVLTVPDIGPRVSMQSNVVSPYRRTAHEVHGAPALDYNCRSGYTIGFITAQLPPVVR